MNTGLNPHRKRRLGRGLEALLGATGELDDHELIESTGSSPGNEQLVQLSVNEIEDNPFQPRREFSEPELASLAESLKTHDMLQPILVRIVDGRYQLISGERRLRAAIRAGWNTIPARIRQADDRLVAELAIVENLQRTDLNAIEKALSFRRYIEQHGCTQEYLANRLKIDRSTLANMMRLLDLPEAIQEALRSSKITMGHARALLPMGDEVAQLALCNRIQREGLNVRVTERLVSDFIAREDKPGPATRIRSRTTNHQLESLRMEMKFALGTNVDIHLNVRGNGRIVVHFSNQREFERLREMFRAQGEARRAA
jgi:ParB family chromosome partitioning protein